MAIEHVDVVGESLQAVRESFRDEERNPVLVAQRLSMPAQEGRRAPAQIDGDVMESTPLEVHQGTAEVRLIVPADPVR